MSIGEQIIAAIAKCPLVRVVDNEINQFNVNAVLVWSQSASEQLEAVVEAHIEEQEQVRIRVQLDRQERETKMVREICCPNCGGSHEPAGRNAYCGNCSKRFRAQRRFDGCDKLTGELYHESNPDGLTD